MQAFLFLAMVKAIDDDVTVQIAGKDVDPSYDRAGDEVCVAGIW